MSFNHYRTLGLANFASAREVQKAFRMLAMQYHPDKHGGSTIFEHKFKEVNAAYQVLSDPIQKAQYDNLLRFGSFTTTTQQTPKPTPRTWTPPPVQELKYTPFQEVYIKVSMGVVALYLIILILSHIFSSPISPGDMIQKINKDYFQKTIQYTASKDFEKASLYLDSVILIGNASAHYSDLQRNLLAQIENVAVSKFKSKEYALSLENYLLLEQLSLQHGYEFYYQNKARIVMCLAYTNQNEELIQRLELFTQLSILDFESAFASSLLDNYSAIQYL